MIIKFRGFFMGKFFSAFSPDLKSADNSGFVDTLLDIFKKYLF
jgi:hypothetical protein